VGALEGGRGKGLSAAAAVRLLQERQSIPCLGGRVIEPGVGLACFSKAHDRRINGLMPESSGGMKPKYRIVGSPGADGSLKGRPGIGLRQRSSRPGQVCIILVLCKSGSEGSPGAQTLLNRKGCDAGPCRIMAPLCDMPNGAASPDGWGFVCMTISGWAFKRGGRG